MENWRPEEEKINKDIRNLFRQKKKQLKQLKIEHLQILTIFLSMKKNKENIINQ